MKPTPLGPQTTTEETAADRFEEHLYDAMLYKQLDKNTKLHQPPSRHIQAWRAHERAWYFARCRHPSHSRMGYNLWTDATRGLRWAYQLLTDDNFRQSTGFQKQTAPRRALARLAEAFGDRYMRGLVVIEGELTQDQLAQFQQERMVFRQLFELFADFAHTNNDKGLNPGAVLEVVEMFRAELLALCPWLEKVGQTAGAKILREEVTLPMTR